MNTAQTKSQLREQRLQELLNSCQQQVLQQVIGPFGLTPAMFEDKAGGNVTTQHNADQGIFAKGTEEYGRDADYDYTQAKKDKMRILIYVNTDSGQYEHPAFPALGSVLF